MASNHDDNRPVGDQNSWIRAEDPGTSGLQIKPPKKREIGTNILTDPEIEIIKLSGQLELIELRGRIMRVAEWIASLAIGVAACILVDVLRAPGARLVAILGCVAVAATAGFASFWQSRKIAEKRSQTRQDAERGSTSSLGLSSS